jgi:acyl-coenzyme A synthetase/AMP-(fatty) acid ligase
MTVMAGSAPTRTLLEAGMTCLSKDILCLYGATEIGLVTRAMARDILVSPGLAGFVVPGVEVLIVDAAGQSCAPGQIGSIKVRHTEDDGRGASLSWITLGDYGWFAPDGRLYVVGRATGEATPEKKISTAIEAEHVLRLAFDYTDAAAVLQEKAGAKPLIQIGIVKNIDASAGKVEALLSERGIDATVELYGLASIPRGAGGKVNRSQLKSALEAAQPIPRGPV